MRDFCYFCKSFHLLTIRLYYFLCPGMLTQAVNNIVHWHGSPAHLAVFARRDNCRRAAPRCSRRCFRVCRSFVCFNHHFRCACSGSYQGTNCVFHVAASFEECSVRFRFFVDSAQFYNVSRAVFEIVRLQTASRSQTFFRLKH